MDVKSFIAKVKSKPELRGVSDEFVEGVLATYLKKYALPRTKHEERTALKEIRSQLRLHTGRFHKKKITSASLSEMLAEHTSTREREPHYKHLQSLIATLHPRSILDIGCGLNPLVLAEKGIVYHACDIRQDEVDRINAHFAHNHLEGNAFVADARSYDSFPKADVCLMLKLLDLLDTRGRANAESLIKRVPASTLIVSFPTRKLSGKKMNHPRRRWFEQMMNRLGYTFYTSSTDNELFYIVTKS